MGDLSELWMLARICVHGAAGGGVFFGIYRIITMGMKNRWVSNSWASLLSYTSQKQRQRESVYRRQYEEVGIQEKLSLVQRWDQCFAQSMLQRRYPGLNAQLYISLLLMGASAAGLLGLLICLSRPLFGIGVGLALFVGILLAGVFYVNLLRAGNLNRTEKELMPFLNIVDNFSKTEQDLFQIFDLATPYVREPLQSALKECGMHAQATGNRSEAIRDLIYQVEHPKFREMIQNLEICSRNEANYTKIMGDMRDSLSSYLSNRKEESGILREGQVQIGVITGMGLPMIAMLTAITQIPLKGMLDNLFGRCILIYWIVLIIFIVYQMGFATGGKESQ